MLCKPTTNRLQQLTEYETVQYSRDSLPNNDLGEEVKIARKFGKHHP